MASLTRFTANVSNHQSQPDQPALTSAELKKLFDKAPEDIKEYLNQTLLVELENVINDMVSTTDIENDVTAGGTTKVASAEIAKILNNTKQNKIQVGTDIPTELEDGELYIQVF